MEELKEIARCIVEVLSGCGFDDVTDSSGYYVIKKFEDETERTVDVYKSTSTLDGKPRYVIYCSYEDEESDYLYTDDLSEEGLASKLEEFYAA